MKYKIGVIFIPRYLLLCRVCVRDCGQAIIPGGQLLFVYQLNKTFLILGVATLVRSIAGDKQKNGMVALTLNRHSPW